MPITPKLGRRIVMHAKAAKLSARLAVRTRIKANRQAKAAVRHLSKTRQLAAFTRPKLLTRIRRGF